MICCSFVYTDSVGPELPVCVFVGPRLKFQPGYFLPCRLHVPETYLSDQVVCFPVLLPLFSDQFGCFFLIFVVLHHWFMDFLLEKFDFFT